MGRGPSHRRRRRRCFHEIHSRRRSVHLRARLIPLSSVVYTSRRHFIPDTFSATIRYESAGRFLQKQYLVTFKFSTKYFPDKIRYRTSGITVGKKYVFSKCVRSQRIKRLPEKPEKKRIKFLRFKVDYFVSIDFTFY